MENDVSIFIFISRNMNWKKHLDKNYLKTFRWRMWKEEPIQEAFECICG